MDRDARSQWVNFIRFVIGSLFILLGKPLLNRQVTTFVFHEVSDTPRAHARETRAYSDVKTFGKQIDSFSNNSCNDFTIKLKFAS